MKASSGEHLGKSFSPILLKLWLMVSFRKMIIKKTMYSFFSIHSWNLSHINKSTSMKEYVPKFILTHCVFSNKLKTKETTTVRETVEFSHPYHECYWACVEFKAILVDLKKFPHSLWNIKKPWCERMCMMQSHFCLWSYNLYVYVYRIKCTWRKILADMF